ncbi:MAG TPA: 6-phosphogluconolactonase [Woeseiaceae bacterium]|nr:6-phosphogluconolactonase [Woeseiaceae bacterium]
MIEHIFPDRDAASVAVAERIEHLLAGRLAMHAGAAFVVSGGSSPKATYAKLADKNLDWHRVHAILSDERWVPNDSDDSNERMIRETLITARATGLSLMPFYSAGIDLSDQCVQIDKHLRQLPLPFACTLLGMGTDGHFASLFPGISNLDEGLNLASGSWSIPVRRPGNPHDRVSLTLGALTTSDEIILLIFGEEKRVVAMQAAQSESRYPVGRLFAQQRAPVHVFWAP